MRHGPNHGERVQQAIMYAHSVQGFNRRTTSYQAAPGYGEEKSWGGLLCLKRGSWFAASANPDLMGYASSDTVCLQLIVVIRY